MIFENYIRQDILPAWKSIHDIDECKELVDLIILTINPTTAREFLEVTATIRYVMDDRFDYYSSSSTEDLYDYYEEQIEELLKEAEDEA